MIRSRVMAAVAQQPMEMRRWLGEPWLAQARLPAGYANASTAAFPDEEPETSAANATPTPGVKAEAAGADSMPSISRLGGAMFANGRTHPALSLRTIVDFDDEAATPNDCRQSLEECWPEAPWLSPAQRTADCAKSCVKGSSSIPVAHRDSEIDAAAVTPVARSSVSCSSALGNSRPYGASLSLNGGHARRAVFPGAEVEREDGAVKPLERRRLTPAVCMPAAAAAQSPGTSAPQPRATASRPCARTVRVARSLSPDLRLVWNPPTVQALAPTDDGARPPEKGTHCLGAASVVPNEDIGPDSSCGLFSELTFAHARYAAFCRRFEVSDDTEGVASLYKDTAELAQPDAKRGDARTSNRAGGEGTYVNVRHGGARAGCAGAAPILAGSKSPGQSDDSRAWVAAALASRSWSNLRAEEEEREAAVSRARHRLLAFRALYPGPLPAGIPPTGLESGDGDDAAAKNDRQARCGDDDGDGIVGTQLRKDASSYTSCTRFAASCGTPSHLDRSTAVTGAVASGMGRVIEITLVCQPATGRHGVARAVAPHVGVDAHGRRGIHAAVGSSRAAAEASGASGAAADTAGPAVPGGPDAASGRQAFSAYRQASRDAEFQLLQAFRARCHD